MSGESVTVIWNFLASVMFFGLSLVGGAVVAVLAVWKGHDLWLRLKHG